MDGRANDLGSARPAGRSCDRASRGSALLPDPVLHASTAYGLLAGLPAYARSQRRSPLRGSPSQPFGLRA
jgi:hypothetical protein